MRFPGLVNNSENTSFLTMGSAGISPLPKPIHAHFPALCQLLSFLSFILSIEIKNLDPPISGNNPGGMGAGLSSDWPAHG